MSVDDSNRERAIDRPVDILAGTPQAAYFWGYVAGAGTVTESRIELTTDDETAAQRLATIAGVDDVDHETSTRAYAHDTSITRTEDEYTITIAASEDGRLFGRSSVLGFPVDGRGGYRFEAFTAHERELLRGLLEACGTICFKSSQGTVGISFVHDDRGLLDAIRELIASVPADVPVDDIAETSSGGYWFGVDDTAVPSLGSWLYANCEETGCFTPSRRRKLETSLAQASAPDRGSRTD